MNSLVLNLLYSKEIKNCDFVIELEENTKKLEQLKEKLQQIGDSL
ncbi:MAG: hypothetical protein ACLR6T_01015 [Intestinibacter sp.]